MGKSGVQCPTPPVCSVAVRLVCSGPCIQHETHAQGHAQGHAQTHTGLHEQASAVPWHILWCRSMLRHASTCTCGSPLPIDPGLTNGRQHMQKLLGQINHSHPSKSSVVPLFPHNVVPGPRFACKPSMRILCSCRAHSPLKQPLLPSTMLHKGCSKVSQACFS